MSAGMVETTDFERVARILADGFFDNPLTRWMFLDEATRLEALREWFSFWADAYGKQALCFVLPGDTGAALWAKPGTPGMNDSQQAAMIAVIQRWNGDRTGLVLQGLIPLAAHPPEPHWYLNAIAILPAGRARGAGARLLEPMLERSDREAIPIYLESSNPRNLSFYERYDFAHVGDPIFMPQDGPPAQPMLRAAKTPS